MSTEIPLSGVYYPNKFARIFMLATEQVAGKDVLNSALHSLGLDQYIDNYPPDTNDREFDFAHLSALTAGIEEVASAQFRRNIMLRIGHVIFGPGLKNYGVAVGAHRGYEMAGQVSQLIRIEAGLNAFAYIFSTFSDQTTEVQKFDGYFLYTIKVCPVCWGRTAHTPICYSAVGLLKEGLKWITNGKEFRVIERECHAKGNEHCTFVIEY